MKKLLLLCFLLPVFAFTSFDWITVNFDEKFSLDFPKEPEQQEMNGSPVWMADIDSNSRCMALVMDFAQFGLDSAGLAAEMSKPEALEQFRTSFMAQLGTAELISEKSTKIQGYLTFEYVVEMGKENVPLNMHNKNIFIGSKLYSLSYYEKKGFENAENRDRFFNSVKIK